MPMVWDIIHLKGDFHSSVWSTKTFFYDIREVFFATLQVPRPLTFCMSDRKATIDKYSNNMETKFSVLTNDLTNRVDFLRWGPHLVPQNLFKHLQKNYVTSWCPPFLLGKLSVTKLNSNFNFNLIWSWVEFSITLQSSDHPLTNKSRDNNLVVPRFTLVSSKVIKIESKLHINSSKLHQRCIYVHLR